MASPSMTTSHAAGNLFSTPSIAASGTDSFQVDYSTKFEGQVQLSVTFGTVAATAGLQFEARRRIGSGPATDTQAAISGAVAAVGSSTERKSFVLPTGRWDVKLTNLDATNVVTSVTATDDTVDGIS